MPLLPRFSRLRRCNRRRLLERRGQGSDGESDRQGTRRIAPGRKRRPNGPNGWRTGENRQNPSRSAKWKGLCQSSSQSRGGAANELDSTRAARDKPSGSSITFGRAPGDTGLVTEAQAELQMHIFWRAPPCCQKCLRNLNFSRTMILAFRVNCSERGPA
jgi:hypothetical protein